ncbi:MAG: 16S rRNA (cytidine(1402)-2'-O)-methyltransferase [Candidatus Krumholzibacteriia bacterium]
MNDPHNENPCGAVCLVSTPIGNLGDMTYRGIEALKTADAVLAEDTRRTRRLFDHYGIKNRLIAYHDHNKERVTPALVRRCKDGDTLALVSDAGTPGISDPGFYLVRAAIAEGIAVRVVPGANAILPALLLSGFPTDAFVFEGFLPRKKGELGRRFEGLAEERRTAIFFVPPHRLITVLGVLNGALPARELAVVREISKVHEEVRRGTAAELIGHFGERRVRGEIVLLIRGKGK